MFYFEKILFFRHFDPKTFDAPFVALKVQPKLIG